MKMHYEYLINFFNLWHIFTQQLFCARMLSNIAYFSIKYEVSSIAPDHRKQGPVTRNSLIFHHILPSISTRRAGGVCVCVCVCGADMLLSHPELFL